MDALDMLKENLNFAHRTYVDARNATDEQLHFVPEDGSHSIAWCLWHTARIEDNLVQNRYRQTDVLWNEEWANRTGLSATDPFIGMSDEDAQKIRLTDKDAFFEYVDAVWAATAEFLDRPWPVGDVIGRVRPCYVGGRPGTRRCRRRIQPRHVRLTSPRISPGASRGRRDPRVSRTTAVQPFGSGPGRLRPGGF